jgi:Uma2 family endonuclease
MATVSASTTKTTPEPEERFVLRNVGWSGYEALLQMIGDRHTRVTYDRGDAELMSPSRDHDLFAELIGDIIKEVCRGLRLPSQSLRSTTWRARAKERGLEADNCFYLKSLPRIRGKRGDLDLTVDPPPDLAIEIEISRSALDRMGVYASLGVPEVWRFDGETLTIERLQDNGSYATAERSVELPAISPEEVVHWAQRGEEIDDHTEWGCDLREWVRAEVLPRWRGNRED